MLSSYLSNRAAVSTLLGVRIPWRIRSTGHGMIRRLKGVAPRGAPGSRGAPPLPLRRTQLQFYLGVVELLQFSWVYLSGSAP